MDINDANKHYNLGYIKGVQSAMKAFGGEWSKDFAKRILHQKSKQELICILNEYIKAENYEFCSIVRDVAIERGITLT